MGIILAPIALILFTIIFIIESIFSMVFRTKKRKWFKLFSNKMYNKAMIIDIFGNYLFADFWNWLFSKKGDNYKFGILGETISSVLGKKYLEQSLSKIGIIFYYILYFIDIPSWKHGGHCYRWIMNEQQIKNFIK